MVAVFKLVPLPIKRPTYRRPDLLSFKKDWIEANRDLLVDWFGDAPGKDWELFCNHQHARECDQHDQFKDTYRGP